MSLNLTREQTIEEHRKMWRWIAENGWEKKIRDGCDVCTLKRQYLSKYFPNQDITNNCFCCEYSRKNLFSFCKWCPLDWGNDEKEFNCEYKGSPYRKLRDIMYNRCDEKEFQRLALEIANLPEREV